ncbi:unnamed protein product [Enterobius vermicularis]|uniref:Uncharacterized protein n=1 Tax=Enterobius vermicularis TaxID=51028 RepID=A0A0N4VNP3_ENTVE|nr:unnamed protein product [Enterobius vermicularis]
MSVQAFSVKLGGRSEKQCADAQRDLRPPRAASLLFVRRDQHHTTRSPLNARGPEVSLAGILKPEFFLRSEQRVTVKRAASAKRHLGRAWTADLLCVRQM